MNIILYFHPYLYWVIRVMHIKADTICQKLPDYIQTVSLVPIYFLGPNPFGCTLLAGSVYYIVTVYFALRALRQLGLFAPLDEFSLEGGSFDGRTGGSSILTGS